MKKLGWKPKVNLGELIKMMIEHDLQLAERETHLQNGGFKTENFYE